MFHLGMFHLGMFHLGMFHLLKTIYCERFTNFT